MLVFHFRISVAPHLRKKQMTTPKIELITGIAGKDGSHHAELLLDGDYILHPEIMNRSPSY